MRRGAGEGRDDIIGRSGFCGCSRFGMGGRWFHSTLFILRLLLVSFDFAALDSDPGLSSSLRAGGGFSVAPEQTESRADSAKGHCKRPAPPRDWSFHRSCFPGRLCRALPAVNSRRPLLRVPAALASRPGSGFHGAERHFHGFAHLHHSLLGAHCGSARALVQNFDGLRIRDGGAPLLNGLQYFQE